MFFLKRMPLKWIILESNNILLTVLKSVKSKYTHCCQTFSFSLPGFPEFDVLYNLNKIIFILFWQSHRQSTSDSNRANQKILKLDRTECFVKLSLHCEKILVQKWWWFSHGIMIKCNDKSSKETPFCSSTFSFLL